MKKDPKVFLAHIIESVELIEEYSHSVTQAQFLGDRVLQDAIIRRLEVIGEAVKALPLTLRAKSPEVPWKQMAGMRDVLIHEYFDVDLILTWRVVKHELPKIKLKILELLLIE
ncbi:MAG: DUF86 domain-containing protein [Verrucomicrobia bacterium]|nr:DUF86 domain-containing protein [Verrucomicrobiota bacterium]